MLETISLVHEAYLKFVHVDELQVQDRNAAAKEILTQKRGELQCTRRP
jgi:hypothetical protein